MFKIGDKVRLTEDRFKCKAGDVLNVVEFVNEHEWCSCDKIEVEGINREDVGIYFELVEEQPTKHLKQNWSIRVHSKEQAEVYEKTLIALGYILSDSTQKEWTPGTKSLYHSDGQQDYFWYSGHTSVLGEDRHFDNLESFLAWHFQEEETEQQKRIQERREQLKELEETIARAQQQIEQLKKGL